MQILFCVQACACFMISKCVKCCWGRSTPCKEFLFRYVDQMVLGSNKYWASRSTRFVLALSISFRLSFDKSPFYVPKVCQSFRGVDRLPLKHSWMQRISFNWRLSTPSTWNRMVDRPFQRRNLLMTCTWMRRSTRFWTGVPCLQCFLWLHVSSFCVSELLEKMGESIDSLVRTPF